MVPHDRLVNFRPVIFPLATSFFLLWLCAISLPEKGTLPILFRISVLPFLLATAFDIAVNKTYSLGSSLRDVMFPYCGCLIAFRILDMALVSLWDENPAPKWIKPRDMPEEHVSNSVISYESHDQKEGEEVSVAPFHDGQGSARSPRDELSLGPVAHSPLFSFDRALYGLDVLLLNRPGTPWLFPWRLRSLDWSLAALNGQRREKLKFGKPEWPFLLALIQQRYDALYHACESLPDANYQSSLYDLTHFLGTWHDDVFRRTRRSHTHRKEILPSANSSVLRRIWMYVVLIGTGRYLANSMVVKGWLSAYEWNQMNYPNVIADLFGRNIPV
ncbi:hypothetical protein KEM48_007422 [Puccinia striiformis f. sp. tritici PST-130]|nr:hypothetical protein KEM48_007422 [Puccinia striiformis f. sp. tritici PST-130]